MTVALELFISRRAAKEIDRVAGWWAANRPAAPGAVRKDLKASMSFALNLPFGSDLRIARALAMISSPVTSAFAGPRLSAVRAVAVGCKR